MFFLFLILMHLTSAQVNQWTTFDWNLYYEPVMVNGKPVSGSDYPWIVSLRSVYPQYAFVGTTIVFYHRFCAGSLISIDPITILTAAHCVEMFEYDAVRNSITESGDIVQLHADLGRTKGPYLNNPYDESADTWITLQITDINFIHIHPDYNGYRIQDGNDIALIIFNDEQRLPDNYPFVSIPNQLSNDEECCQAGDQLIAIGYGIDEDQDEGGMPTNTLQRITMTYIMSIDDNKQIAVVGNRENDQGVCSGDSGGPLFRLLDDGTIEVVGITSYTIAIGLNGEDFCNSVHPNAEPSFFTSTAHFNDWIQQVIDPTPKFISTNAPTVKATGRPTVTASTTSLAPTMKPVNNSIIATNAPSEASSPDQPISEEKSSSTNLSVSTATLIGIMLVLLIIV